MTSILVTTVGSRGDVQPFLAFANSLRTRGHEVTFSTGAGFEKLLAGSGIATAPLSVNMQALINDPNVQDAMNSWRGKWRAYHATKHTIEKQHEEIWNIITDLKPDMIVYSPKAFIANHAARAIGAIAIPAFLQPAFSATRAFANPLLRFPGDNAMGNRLSWALIMRIMRFGYRASLSGFRKRRPELKLGSDVDVMDGYAPSGAVTPRLYAHSKHLVPKPVDWKVQDAVTGAWFADLNEEWEPPAGLTAFLDDGPPPVYIGFGSMPSSNEEALAQLVTGAIKKAGIRAIIARGWGALGNIEATDNIHVLDGAPHDWLFPKCAAVVHHGGAGTSHEGLRWGRPTLICPVFGDQPFWAEIVHRLGAGPKPIPHQKLNVENLANALEALQAPDYAKAAGKLGELIRREDGVKTAAELIEQIAENGS